MNFELLTALQAQGKKVKAAPLGRNYPLTGGCAVVVIDPKVWQSTLPPYSIGVVEGGPKPYGLGQGVSITFNFSAYKQNEYCEASGGPGTIHTPVECLRFTGIAIEISFWKFRNGLRMANNSEYYKQYVPLFEYYQSEEAALVKKIPIDQSEYEASKTAHSIHITDNSFFMERLHPENPEKVCWAYKTDAFAVPEIVTKTSETKVLTVYYREYYTTWNTDANAYIQYQPDAYFRQDMLVYTPAFTAIGKIENHYNGRSYKAQKYYKHNLTHLQSSCLIDIPQA